MALSAASLASAAEIVVNFGPTTTVSDFNYTQFAQGQKDVVLSNLAGADGNVTDISLTISATGGIHWNRTSSVAFNNAVALAEMESVLGFSLPEFALEGYVTNGQQDPTTSYTFSGLTAGDTATLYFFATTDNTNSGDRLPSSFNMNGVLDSEFSFASSDGSGFTDTMPTDALDGKFMLVKWTGVIDAESITLSTSGDRRFGLGYLALQTQSVPEPASAIFAMLGVSVVALRRKR